ncbi:MAG: hypothetical protein GY940_28270, partial [bacterium]|nr:hypothetical protein [bacterium]
HYKTGDLARWSEDGNIEFLGRIDQQVKIRGFRIEPGEIEVLLKTHETVKEAVVIDREDGDGDKYLCAYVIAAGAENVPETGELRDFLSRTLPDYMIPSYFVQLETIPLTPSGKVDRNRLPAPGLTAEDNYVAPRDRLERQLVELWQEVLAWDDGSNGPSIGIDDDFFQLGGHSLRGTVLVTKIHKALHTKISLTQLFSTPTIRGLAQTIRETKQDRYASIEPAEKRDYYPLSSPQKRLFIL